jgi:hypothetical protein
VKLLSEPGLNSDTPTSELQLSALSISLKPQSLSVRELLITASLPHVRENAMNAAGAIVEQCDASCVVVPVFQRQQDQYSVAHNAPSDMLMIDWQQQQRRANSVSTSSSSSVRGSSSSDSSGGSNGVTTTAVVCAQLQPFLVHPNTGLISR